MLRGDGALLFLPASELEGCARCDVSSSPVLELVDD